MQIRELTFDDWPRLFDFFRSLPEEVTKFYQPFPPEVKADVLKDRLRDCGGGKRFYLGLFDRPHRIVGFGALADLTSERSAFGIGLHPSVQGKGWGRKLSEAVLDRADRLGLPVVHLSVVKENTRAQSLYLKLGFSITGDDTCRLENDSYRMVRALPE